MKLSINWNNISPTTEQEEEAHAQLEGSTSINWVNFERGETFYFASGSETDAEFDFVIVALDEDRIILDAVEAE